MGKSVEKFDDNTSQTLVRPGTWLLLAVCLILPFVSALLVQFTKFPWFTVPAIQFIASSVALGCYFTIWKNARQAIRLTGTRLCQLEKALESMPDGVILIDTNAQVLFVNEAYFRLNKFERSTIRPGMTVQEIIDARRRSGFSILTREQHGNGEIGAPISDAQFWEAPEGQIVRAQAFGGKDGSFSVLHRDVSKDIDQRKKLDETRQFLNSIIDRIPEAVAVKSADTLAYKLVNHAFERMMGRPRGAIIGKTVSEIHPGSAAEMVTVTDVDTIFSGKDKTTTRPISLGGADGQGMRIVRAQRIVLKDETGKVRYLLSVTQDLTEKLKIEKELVRLATRDPTTGLLNRSQFDNRISRIASSKVDGSAPQQIAIAVIDLDGFKEVNDTFGHAGGDVVLKHVGSILSRMNSSGYEAFRLGGDEFALAITGQAEQDRLIPVLRSIMEQIESPVEFDGQKAYVRCSIGVAIGNPSTADAQTIVQQADLALYEAKHQGKGCICEFSPDMLTGRLRRKAIEAELYDAIGSDQFVLHYQPIVTSSDRRICSVEALVRWNHPTRGLVRPDQFIPIAEESGLIKKIGLQLLVRACQDAVNWPTDVRLSVNLSPIQFRDDSLTDEIHRILKHTGLPSDRLELEITEAALLKDTEKNLKSLRSLKELGIRIVMDDFGTGYSSLTYLKRFPFDKIKIDKSYVDGLLETNDNSRPILKGIFALASELGIATTAEGVENECQAEFLLAEGCSQMQGFLFSKPIPLNDLNSLLDSVITSSMLTVTCR